MNRITRSKVNNKIVTEDFIVDNGISSKPSVEADNILESIKCSSNDPTDLYFDLLITPEFLVRSSTHRQVLQCPLCGDKCFTNNNMKKHFSRQHVNPLFVESYNKGLNMKCNICNLYYDRHSLLITKEILLLLDDMFNCIDGFEHSPNNHNLILHMFRCGICEQHNNQNHLIHFNTYEDIKSHSREFHKFDPLTFQTDAPITKRKHDKTDSSSDEMICQHPFYNRYSRNELATYRRYGPINRNGFVFNAKEQAFLFGVSQRNRNNHKNYIDGKQTDLNRLHSKIGTLLTECESSYTHLDEIVMIYKDDIPFKSGLELQQAADEFYGITSGDRKDLPCVGYLHANPLVYLFEHVIKRPKVENMCDESFLDSL